MPKRDLLFGMYYLKESLPFHKSSSSSKQTNSFGTYTLLNLSFIKNIFYYSTNLVNLSLLSSFKSSSESWFKSSILSAKGEKKKKKRSLESLSRHNHIKNWNFQEWILTP